ncbi:MAG: Hpt domain-containing protein [Proteobacteria bacterium]|nr:MAG: Hpt domain-containing protein [Pseudomonadota bacterium]
MEAPFDAVASIETIEKNYGPEVTREVVQIFLTAYTAKIEKLRSAIISGEVEKIRFTAHDIKSGCLSMGAKPMSAICQTIEKEGTKFSKQELLEMTDTLKQEYATISETYKAYLQRDH